MIEKIIITILGISIAAIATVIKRDKDSKATPHKFSFSFYVKDNYVTHILSALLSLFLVATYDLIGFDTYISKQFSAPENYEFFEKISAFLCGFAPHYALALLDKATKVFTPSKVTSDGIVYERKENENG